MKFCILFADMEDRDIAQALLWDVWACMKRDKLVERVFYDGNVGSGAEFREHLLRPGSLPFVVLADCEIAACSWLNCIEGRAARTHFVIFRKFWGRRWRCEIGRRLYSYILTRKDGMGYLLDCLYGITPANNPLAWKAALSCGWERGGEIAKACYIAKEGKSVNGIVTCATREILGIEDGYAGDAVWDA